MTHAIDPASGSQPARRRRSSPFTGGAMLVTSAAWLAGDVAAQPPMVPPPVKQSSADCSRPVYATDQLVCGDPELRALDAKLVALLPRIDSLRNPWIKPGQQWFARRSRCAFSSDHRACAKGAYEDRLRQPTFVVAGDMRDAVCSDRRVVRVGLAKGAAGLFDQDGTLMAAGSRERIGHFWQPYLTYRKSGRHLIFRTLGDTRLDYRLR